MFERYINLLYRICFSILLHKEDAEDAVQDVFLIYYRKQPEFVDEEHEKAWFIRIAVNRCRDLLRRRKIRASVPLSEVEEILTAGGVEQEESETLKAIYSLPEKYRIVMVLHYLEEYSVRGTARLCGITESAVKMRLMRARELLRKSLGKEL